MDAAGRALRPAIMYNDGRAVDEAAEVQAAGRAQAERLGYQFQPSFGLPRLLWIRRHEPGCLSALPAFSRGRFPGGPADGRSGALGLFGTR